MSLYTRKEFASLCRTTTAVVTTNINRDKIILFDKKIDSENPVNKAFFDKYHKKAEEEMRTKKAKKDISNDIQTLYKAVVKKADKKSKKKELNESRQKGQVSLDWDTRKKRAEALLKERTAEKALLSLKKMYGEMVPTEFVTIMFATFTKTIFSVFDNSIMNLAGVYCDELAGGDREALAKVNQRLNEEFQEIINNASDIAKKDMTNAIKEYSIKRSKGERE